MHVLIVEDEPFCHELMRRVLYDAGYHTESAFSVDEAISKIEEQDFEAIVTDIIMPVKHGSHLIDYVRNKDRTIPIVAVTGGFENAKSDYLNHAEMIADAAVSKPFVNAEFLKIVESVAVANR